MSHAVGIDEIGIDEFLSVDPDTLPTMKNDLAWHDFYVTCPRCQGYGRMAILRIDGEWHRKLISHVCPLPPDLTAFEGRC